MYSAVNFAQTTTVVTAPSPAGSGTTLTLAVGGADLLWNVKRTAGTVTQGARSSWTWLTIYPAGQTPTAANAEIVLGYYSGGQFGSTTSSDVISLMRAQQGTAARAIQVGDIVATYPTAESHASGPRALATSPWQPGSFYVWGGAPALQLGTTGPGWSGPAVNGTAEIRNGWTVGGTGGAATNALASSTNFDGKGLIYAPLPQGTTSAQWALSLNGAIPNGFLRVALAAWYSVPVMYLKINPGSYEIYSDQAGTQVITAAGTPASGDQIFLEMRGMTMNATIIKPGVHAFASTATSSNQPNMFAYTRAEAHLYGTVTGGASNLISQVDAVTVM